MSAINARRALAVIACLLLASCSSRTSVRAEDHACIERSDHRLFGLTLLSNEFLTDCEDVR